jgi:uncharacterized protein YjbI with pentapeptide repeats
MAQPLLARALSLCREGAEWESALAELPFSGEVEGGRDLRGAPLAGANLAGLDLTGARLEGADLRGTDLSEAILSRADLSGARASDAVFWRAELPDCVLEGADLAKTNFYEANLTRARLAGARLDEAYLERVSMSRVSLSGASLFGARLKAADLSDGDLSGAHAEGADLTEADLSRANLEGTDLAGAVLVGANLSSASMRGCGAAGADLAGAALSRADLVEADLAECDLSGANLQEANLTHANLRRADLREAVMARANLQGAMLEMAVLVRADLEGASLVEALLAGANLSEANCRGSSWMDADVSGACFQHAGLHGSNIFLARGLESVEAGEVDVNAEHGRTTYVRWVDVGERLRAHREGAFPATVSSPEAPGLAAQLRAGSSFGRYVIEAQLGEGGMGRIYRALDQRLGRRVALKVLRGGDRNVDVAQRTLRLEREARATALLDTPHAVSVFDIGEVDGTPFIAMELVSGRTLSHYAGRKRPGWPTRIRWLAEMASALAAAHRLGIVHRDVKPENVMVRDDGFVKVLDFGIARRAMASGAEPHPGGDALATLTLDGAVVGTPLYMAPEQIKGAQLDGRADQFAWAVTGYQLLTGKPPWSGSSFAILAKILMEDPVGIRTLCPHIPEPVTRVFERAMSKSPDDRFPSMDAVVSALQPFAAAVDDVEPPG